MTHDTNCEDKPTGDEFKIFCKSCGIHLSWIWADNPKEICSNCEPQPISL